MNMPIQWASESLKTRLPSGVLTFSFLGWVFRFFNGVYIHFYMS